MVVCLMLLVVAGENNVADGTVKHAAAHTFNALP